MLVIIILIVVDLKNNSSYYYRKMGFKCRRVMTTLNIIKIIITISIHIQLDQLVVQFITSFIIMGV